MRKIIFICILLFSFEEPFCQDLKAKEYLAKMMEAIGRINTATYKLKLHERIGDQQFKDSEFDIKLHVRPFKLYALSIFPNAGAEALLVDGRNNQKTLINPNRFPYININLNPQSSLLRKNHHFSMREIGFEYVENLLKGYINRNAEEFFRILHFHDQIEYQGKKYFLLELDYPSYSFMNYTVQKGENLTSIAHKLLIIDFKILSINPGINSYDDVKAGQVIKVPNVFARKIVLYLDPVSFLPVIQTVYDDKGLFGRYEIHRLVLNPAFGPDEFTPSFSGYRF